jgi:hypothetical protein
MTVSFTPYKRNKKKNDPEGTGLPVVILCEGLLLLAAFMGLLDILKG